MTYLQEKKVKIKKSEGTICVYRYLCEFESKLNKKTGKIQKKQIRKIGNIIELEKINEIDFNPLDFLEFSDNKEIFKGLFRNVLLSYAFIENSPNHYIFENIIVDIDKYIVKKNNKNIVVKINDGFLCSETLKELFNFDVVNESDFQNFLKLLNNSGLLRLRLLDSEQDNELIENHKILLAIMIKKFPNFDMSHYERISFDDFNKNNGW